jgi:hypothetical protein
MGLWLVGIREQVPQDESAVRSTLEPIRTDGTATLDEAPEWNEPDTDHSGQLTGLPDRNVGGAVIPTEKYTPPWLNNAQRNYEYPITSQIASSGTAAGREAAGQQGHGTMMRTETLEPVIRDGGAFGQDYFSSHEKDIQEGAGNYMTPATGGNDWNVVAQQLGTNGARAARNAAYQAAFPDGAWFPAGSN